MARRHLELAVRDSGPGIPTADLPRIFEPYRQAHRGRKGSGLGLAIVKELVEAHAGSIVVDSDRGKEPASPSAFRRLRHSHETPCPRPDAGSSLCGMRCGRLAPRQPEGRSESAQLVARADELVRQGATRPGTRSLRAGRRHAGAGRCARARALQSRAAYVDPSERTP